MSSVRPPIQRRSYWPATTLGLVFSVGIVIGFSWLAVQMFKLIHDEIAQDGSSQQGSVAVVGTQQTVFDWSQEACDHEDVPDLPARAFRDAEGRVHLLASHFVGRSSVGPDLDHVQHSCAVLMRSKRSARPQEFADKEWIAAPYTPDGKTVFALVHDEYHGWEHPNGRCRPENWRRCWYNAVTLVRSDDGGKAFYYAAMPPNNLVAAVPYRYKPGGGTYGVFTPSNIVKRGPFYYSLVVVQPYRAQPAGTCVVRTRNLGDPRSWRAWDGKGYGVTFVDPYQARNAASADHLCEPVSYDQIGTMSTSLTYNTYFRKYLLVGATSSYERSKGRVTYGFSYSLSNDLIHWSRRKLIREVVLPWSYRCGDRNPVLYPSVLDPSSRSRNFETTGRRPYLYFTRLHYAGCKATLDRDLVRVPIEFSK